MHEPALLAAELAWRWCFGLSAWILGIISIRLFLDSLTVRPVDQFLLHTMQPILLIEALQHIFRGSLSRFLLGQTVLLPGLISSLGAGCDLGTHRYAAPSGRDVQDRAG